MSMNDEKIRPSKYANKTHRVTQEKTMANKINWSGREDSNFRPLAPHASALPGCATPRPKHYYTGYVADHRAATD